MRTPCLALAVALVSATAALSLSACGAAAPSPSPTPSHPVSLSPTPTVTGGHAFNVMSYGATGDGTSDDSKALQRAISEAAAVGGTAYLPAGTYACATPLELPDGAHIRGEGDTSWIKGQLVFASGSTIEQLKIGDAGECAVTNAAGASGTTFRDCRFHGGGSSEGVDSSVVYLGGSQGNVSDILFTRCEIERTCYVPPADEDAFAKGVGNTITIHEFCYLPHGGHVEHITFRDCHLGAFNGVAKGALRMMMEAFTWDNRTELVYHGWKDLTFDGCTIEASDNAGLDFADRLVPATGAHSSSGVLVTGCTFLGAASDRSSGYGGLPIIYECPTGIVIRNNTFYASPHAAIGGSHVGQGVSDAPALLVEGNTFDMTSSPVGIEHETGEPCISLVGYGSRVIANTFVYDRGLGVLVKGGSGYSYTTAGNLVKGNTFTDARTANGEPTILFTDDVGRGCRDNHITANTIVNRGAGGAGVIAQISGDGTNYAQSNVIVCGSALPFVVLSGKLVADGNTVRQ